MPKSAADPPQWARWLLTSANAKIAQRDPVGNQRMRGVDVSSRDLRRAKGRRGWAVLAALAIGLGGVAGSGCGDDDSANEAQERIERGVEEAKQGIEKGRQEAEQGLKEARQGVKDGGEEVRKGFEKAEEEAKEGIEKGTEEAEAALEEAEERYSP
jgi:uncharacterized protein HemX